MIGTSQFAPRIGPLQPHQPAGSTARLAHPPTALAQLQVSTSTALVAAKEFGDRGGKRLDPARSTGIPIPSGARRSTSSTLFEKFASYGLVPVLAGEAPEPA